MSTGAQIDSHGKMRARDVSKVAKGEQAPAPPHELGKVSPPPPLSSTDVKVKKTDYHKRICYVRYVEYYRCLEGKKDKKASECDKIAEYYNAMCPDKWIETWDAERERGKFPGPISKQS